MQNTQEMRQNCAKKPHIFKKFLTTMTKRAGATNAQMAPISSDSQQLKQQGKVTKLSITSKSLQCFNANLGIMLLI